MAVVTGDRVDFCRELALDQPLIGSAPQGTRWVLLEDKSRWGAKVPGETDLPEPVKTWLRGLDQPGTRVHLIRRPSPARSSATRRVILAATPEQPERRRVVELDVDLGQIPELDVDALLADAIEAPRKPLWLVCTHGSRDRCCAKWGMPIFDALREHDPGRVWQSSHLGGHRFAPTLVALPVGLMWGRIAAEQAVTIDRALVRDDLEAIEGLRGRMCWPPPAQAAEVVLRRTEPHRPLDWLALREIVEFEPGRHRVEFVDRETGGRRSVELESIDLPATPASCGDQPERRRGLAQLSST